MTEPANDVAQPTTETPGKRRGRPPTEKPKRQSKSWMAEAHAREKERDELRLRVKIALDVLRGTVGTVPPESAMAIRILTGEV
jgi:hypothetical protein